MRTSRAVLVRRSSKAGEHCQLPGTGNYQGRSPEGGSVLHVCEVEEEAGVAEGEWWQVRSEGDLSLWATVRMLAFTLSDVVMVEKHDLT